MPAPFSVALLGFSPFERNTLASYFRLATHRSPSYSLVQTLSAPDFMIADADHSPSVQLALAEDMLARTVFIGSQAPSGVTAWMQRPIDPLHVMRELDAMVPLLSPRAGLQPAGQPSAPQAAAPAGLDTPGDDLPTLILRPRGTPPPASPATPADPLAALPAQAAGQAAADIPLEPTVHGQRTVTLPRRFRPGTIEQAFLGDSHRPPPAPVLPPPVADAPDPAPWTDHGPLPDAPATPATLALPRRPAADTAAQLPPPRALLVDDSELARHFLDRLLQPWGVVCDQATDSTQALRCLSERDYDYIFLDLELGTDSELDGLSLCQHIKRLHNNVQAALATVVMVSAHHSETNRVRGSLAGCDAYLGKPLKLDELQHLLLRQGLKAPAGTLSRPPSVRPG